MKRHTELKKIPGTSGQTATKPTTSKKNNCKSALHPLTQNYYLPKIVLKYFRFYEFHAILENIFPGNFEGTHPSKITKNDSQGSIILVRILLQRAFQSRKCTHKKFEDNNSRGALSGPVFRDTARLSQRYPPIAHYGVCGVSTWPIGCDTPLPLF